ncbi:hypothetical protein D9M69_669210 [compost metagenome]
MSSSQAASGSPIQSRTGRPTIGPMAMTRSGMDSAALTQKRLVKSTSSGLGPSSAEGIIGSSAMPQIGQEPGLSRMISGCIGQVYCEPLGATGAAGLPERYFAGSTLNLSSQLDEQK